MAKHCRSRRGEDDSYAVNSGFVALNEFSRDKQESSVWYIDSGATSHMTFNEEFFTVLNKNHTGLVRLADNKELIVKGIGTVVFSAKFGPTIKKVQLNNVIWVPELKTNLISTSKATDNECKVEMTNNFARISRNNETLVEGEKLEGLYIVTVIHENVNAVEEANINTNLQLWHKRFGHLVS